MQVGERGGCLWVIGYCQRFSKKEIKEKKKKTKTNNNNNQKTPNHRHHSQKAFLVCLHGPCMLAGPGNEFGADLSESLCFLCLWCMRVMWFGLILNQNKPNQNGKKKKNV